jgi:autotransporter-associated beta strand protein
VLTNGTLNLAGTNAVANTITTSTGVSTTIGTVLTGSAGVTKDGAGTLTLSGVNTYTGSTAAQQGKLIVAQGGSLASTNTTVTSAGSSLIVNGTISGVVTATNDGLVGGSGTVIGNTTVNGNLQPGSSPGLMSFSNNLTFGSTAVTTMEINGAGTRGTAFDAVDVTGLLTYDGALTLSIGTTFAEGNYSFDLFDFGSQTGSFDSVTLGDSYSGLLTDNGFGVWGLTSGTETWTFDQGTGVLDLGVVPEPSTYALLTLSAAGLGAHVFARRRRR